MQPTTSGTSSSIGSGRLSRGGLTRFRSAPVTWLESLLEEEVQEEDDLFKTDQCLTQLLTENSASTTSRNPVSFSSSVDPSVFETVPSSGFFRQNSSPAEFLGNSAGSSHGVFSSYALRQEFDYNSDDIVVSPSAVRLREAESPLSSMKHPSQLKLEPGVEMASAAPSLVDKEMEKMLEDSVPCRVRAKRGCATHPRSIAERVRRTRISDRIRKLQELVPNLDKQTNTADMLDEAVAYVKFLQRQIEELSEHQRKCKCVINDEIAAK